MGGGSPPWKKPLHVASMDPGARKNRVEEGDLQQKQQEEEEEEVDPRIQVCGVLEGPKPCSLTPLQGDGGDLLVWVGGGAEAACSAKKAAVCVCV